MSWETWWQITVWMILAAFLVAFIKIVKANGGDKDGE